MKLFQNVLRIIYLNCNFLLKKIKAAKEGGGHLGSKLMKLAQNRDLHHTDMSDTYGLENEQNRDRFKKKNYLNLFQVERGPCRICSNKENKCPFYRACFNIETFRGIDLFSCLNCGCPMNSHVILQSDYNFSNSICQQVNRRYINESHLQFKACVSIFFVDVNTAKDFKIDIESFITSLNEAGFNALSFYEMDIATLQKIWLEKSLYSKKSNIKAQEFQQYYQFYGTFLELIAKFGVADKFALQDCLQNPDDIKILEFYLKRLDKVNQKLGLAYQRNKVAFIFLISGILQLIFLLIIYKIYKIQYRVIKLLFHIIRYLKFYVNIYFLNIIYIYRVLYLQFLKTIKIQLKQNDISYQQTIISYSYKLILRSFYMQLNLKYHIYILIIRSIYMKKLNILINHINHLKESKLVLLKIYFIHNNNNRSFKNFNKNYHKDPKI